MREVWRLLELLAVVCVIVSAIVLGLLVRGAYSYRRREGHWPGDEER